MKLLLIASPVGPLGYGEGGGVELTLTNIAKEISRQGHTVEIVAPIGSTVPEIPVVEMQGQLQQPCQNMSRTAPTVMPENSVLANMWDYARQVQAEFDVIVNFAYDWLPLYLTPFFTTPIVHLISMASLTDAMDEIIGRVATQFPGRVAVHGRMQAASFAFGDRLRVLINGMDLSIYQFCGAPGSCLAWAGRITPEKGVEDAFAAAKITGIPLKIFGLIQNQPYWQQICQDYPDAPVEYAGFLPTAELQRQMGQCRALLVTSRWVEAFGNVAVEALACGVPVIAYRRGGLSEIVRDGKTGFLVEPDSVDGLVAAIGRINEIDRHACRRQAEEEYSLEAMGERVEQWLRDILAKD
jgi:UDP-glucose:tetrahydrobiopterin glucosyltransferase